MKTLLTLLFMSLVYTASVAQKVYYTKDGKKQTFDAETVNIVFSNSKVEVPGKSGPQAAGAILAGIPLVIDAGFKLVNQGLEKSAKRWLAEYSMQKTYLTPRKQMVPNFTFVRNIIVGENKSQALQIEFNALQIPDVNGYVYNLRKIYLQKSSAKSTSKENTFDYTFQIKIEYLLEEKREFVELTPLVVSSVGFEAPQFDSLQHVTQFIPMPKGALFTGVSIKIIESNPAKLRAEKILAGWNNNKDAAKTVINNFLPETEGKGKEEEITEGSDTPKATTLPNTPVSSTGRKQKDDKKR